MATATLVLIAYLLGSISFAILSSRLFGLPDPRSYGSGNPGATNVLRTGRKGAAVLTLIGDAAKGTVAVVIAARFAEIDRVELTMAAAAFAAVLGHVFPVFYKFKGGKGVATAFGVMLGLNAWLAAGTLATWIVIATFFRISSLAALISAAFAAFFALILYNPAHPYFVAVCLVSALLVWRHRSNIRSLMAGTESRLGSK
ncbi:MAG: glycerol-3-phosphate 1-O-acyltransferase PlsY [Burkholderiales bacterium]